MFREILIPVELSERSRLAVETAARMAQPGAATIRLLHVIETIQGASFDELEGFYGTLRERAEAALAQWASWISGKGLQVRSDIVFGRRAAEILRFAAKEPCDLIVLSSHTIEPEHLREGFGTISHQVALFARCPVLLVR